ncbi:MAG: hypothetical protein AB7F65_09675 [Dehalococcoidia bacterium]
MTEEKQAGQTRGPETTAWPKRLWTWVTRTPARRAVLLSLLAATEVVTLVAVLVAWEKFCWPRPDLGDNATAALVALFGAALVVPPVKAAWDEIQLHTHYRLDVALRVAERTHHFTATLYAPLLIILQDIEDHSEQLCTALADDAKSSQSREQINRWLYSIGLWAQVRRRQRAGEGYFIFRSRYEEERVTNALNELRQALDKALDESPATIRSALATAAGNPAVPLEVFRWQLAGDVRTWRDQTLTSSTTLAKALPGVKSAANAARTELHNAVNNLYADWYRNSR